MNGMEAWLKELSISHRIFGPPVRAVFSAIVITFCFAVIGCSPPENAASVDEEAWVGDPIVRRDFGAPNPPETLTILSEILGEERRVYVQLPEGYSNSRAHYPVVLVLDGEWLFELVRAQVRFSSEYEVMDATIPRMIVVGIENVDRDRDYVPTEDPTDPPSFDTAGEADAFLGFLHRELFPLLDREFRTSPGRTVVGWSFGGLAAMYSAVAMPELFNAYLCIGPAIWWDDDMVFELYRTAAFDPPKRMVVTLGSEEEGGLVHTSTTRLLERLDRDPVEGLELNHLVIDGVGHSWGIPPAIDRGLRELFRGFVGPDDPSGSSLDGVETYYGQLSQRWGFEVAPPVSVMLGLAAKMHARERAEEAIAVLEKLVSYEPDAALAFFYLGKYHAGLDHHELALECYRNALAAELRRDVPKGIFLQPYRRAVEKAEAAQNEKCDQE